MWDSLEGSMQCSKSREHPWSNILHVQKRQILPWSPLDPPQWLYLLAQRGFPLQQHMGYILEPVVLHPSHYPVKNKTRNFELYICIINFSSIIHFQGCSRKKLNYVISSCSWPYRPRKLCPLSKTTSQDMHTPTEQKRALSLQYKYLSTIVIYIIFNVRYSTCTSFSPISI